MQALCGYSQLTAVGLSLSLRLCVVLFSQWSSPLWKPCWFNELLLDLISATSTLIIAPGLSDASCYKCSPYQLPLLCFGSLMVANKRSCHFLCTCTVRFVRRRRTKNGPLQCPRGLSVFMWPPQSVGCFIGSSVFRPQYLLPGIVMKHYRFQPGERNVVKVVDNVFFFLPPFVYILILSVCLVHQGSSITEV